MDERDLCERESARRTKGCAMPKGYRLFVSEDGTILVRIWDGGQAEVATRPTPDAVWGPPVRVLEDTSAW